MSVVDNDMDIAASVGMRPELEAKMKEWLVEDQ